ncbi:MAG TPA: hypothetical protein VG983_05805, partial [Caulobacterales bacterium]|nr:hypothetical protein [Caulobacterales bacterium]
MPDVWAGLAILCFALLLAYRDRLKRREAIIVSALLWFALVAHLSHLLTAIVLLAAAAAIAWARRAQLANLRLPAAILAAAIAGSAMGPNLLRLGDLPARAPPFLTARLLEAGPGRAALPAICAKQAFAICAFADRPLTNGAEILWSADRARGVFSASPHQTKARLSREDKAFALAVFARAPLTTLLAAAGGATAQFGAFGMDPELTADAARWRALPPEEFNRAALRRIGACGDRGACAPRLPLPAIGAIDYAVALAALVFLALRGLRLGRGAETAAPAFVAFAAAIAGGALINAAVCGGLSGVYPRYQARLVWLIVLLAWFWAMQ